jgi:hypothetical protein
MVRQIAPVAGDRFQLDRRVQFLAGGEPAVLVTREHVDLAVELDQDVDVDGADLRVTRVDELRDGPGSEGVAHEAVATGQEEVSAADAGRVHRPIHGERAAPQVGRRERLLLPATAGPRPGPGAVVEPVDHPPAVGELADA